MPIIEHQRLDINNRRSLPPFYSDHCSRQSSRVQQRTVFARRSVMHEDIRCTSSASGTPKTLSPESNPGSQESRLLRFQESMRKAQEPSKMQKSQEPSKMQKSQSHCAKERQRVETRNTAYEMLQRKLPTSETFGQKMTKIKTLTTAIRYIKHLKELVEENTEVNYPQDSIFGTDRSDVNRVAVD